MARSGLYRGHVVHTRLRPRRHSLRYRVFSLLLDLDEAPALSQRSSLFGFNRWAPLSVWEKDLGDGRKSGLRDWVEDVLVQAGLDMPHPRIEILSYPRLFGFVFNPLTVYYCSDAGGAVRALIYEVSNTFGERWIYVLRTSEEAGPYRHSCAKQFYVSPFIPMDCRYNFHVLAPGDHVMLRIDETDSEGLLLRAVFGGERREFTDRELAGALFRYPLMTLKVVGAIHWEALRLLLKRVPVFRHRPAANGMTIGGLSGHTVDVNPALEAAETR
ncbi:DUF1365 domain-containing protein [Devosia sp. ZB163]|uniref:DUF1365 domain-containing protein n=1 Tax=Devosia sp. ZB163 TaxID=3025938 RepID=UPI0030811EDD